MENEYVKHQDPNVLHVMVQRMEHLHDDVGEMKSSIKDMTSAIIKLALIEERQSHISGQLERTSFVLDKLDARVDVLEAAAPLQKQASLWVMTGVWSAAGILALVILKSLGIV